MKAAESAPVVNAVDELVNLERRLEESVEKATASPPAIHPEAASVLEGIRAMSQRPRAAIEAQRQRIGAEGPSARGLPVARSLGTVYAALSELAFAYAVLHAAAAASCCCRRASTSSRYASSAWMSIWRS